MNFGDAVDALKRGEPLARPDWNGHIYLETHTAWIIGSGAFKGKQVRYEPCIVLVAAQAHQPGWVPSQADILAEDWVIVDLTQSDDSNSS